MAQKLTRLLEPHFKLYFIVLFSFSAVTVFANVLLGLMEFIATGLLLTYILLQRRSRKRDLNKIFFTLSEELEAAHRDSTLHSPFPMVIFRPETDEIIWSNDLFLGITGERARLFDTRITTSVPSFSSKWLTEGQTECPTEYELRGRRYAVFGHLTEVEQGPLAVTFWVDITELSAIKERFYQTRPVVAILLIDNYDELIRNLPDNARSAMRTAIEEHIDQWCKRSGGMLCRYDRDRYLFIFEEQYLCAYQADKFILLEQVRKVTSPNGISATLSIGLGMDTGFAEMLQYATLAIDMALSRGGDQAVIKNRFNFEFYGGRSREQERRTKVKSRVMASALEELIATASSVFIMGHRHADLDCVGAAAGVCLIARKKQVPVHIISEQNSFPGEEMQRRLAELPAYSNVYVSAQDAAVNLTPESVLVVVDTNRPDQVAAPGLLQACGKIAVIDHHRRAADYIVTAGLNYHEPYASSACELVTELIQYIAEPADMFRQEAEALLAGIVLDTKSFTLRTGGRTFEAAAFLRRCGADTTEVKRMFQTDMSSTVAKYGLIQSAQLYHDGVVVAAADHPVTRVIAAQAADELLNVVGVDASFALYREDDTVYISGRSTGEVNVQVILETLGGGGNGAAAGAQLKDCTLEKGVERLHRSIDRYFSNNNL